jgi:threonine dehydratase
MTAYAISIDDVREASRRLDGAAVRTPLVASALAGPDVALFLKCEQAQRTGAFKLRGAYNAVSRLDAEGRARGVVAYSSGNHGLGVATAGAALGARALVVMPADADPSKIEKIKAEGGEVELFDRTQVDGPALARERAQARGALFLPPADHPDVMAGQGTIALEILEDAPGVEALVLPIGGGGLISGCAIAAKALKPSIRIFGVEPAAAADAQMSFRGKRLIAHVGGFTLADGARAKSVGELNFPPLRDLVEDVVTVDDAALIEAMRALEGEGRMVEPSAALGVAALRSGALRLEGLTAAVVLTGGNVEPARRAAILRGAA